MGGEGSDRGDKPWPAGKGGEGHGKQTGGVDAVFPLLGGGWIRPGLDIQRHPVRPGAPQYGGQAGGGLGRWGDGVPGAAGAGCAASAGKAVVAAAPAERRAAAAPGPLRQRRRHRQQELAGPAGGAVQPPTWGGGEGDLPAPAGPAAAETGGEGAQPAQVGGSAAAPCAGAVRPGVRGVRGHWDGGGVPGHLSGDAVVGGGAPPVAAGAGGGRRGGGGPPLVPAAGLRPPAVFGGL